MEIIILKITNYKEKDGIIDAISKNEKMSFLVRGLFDPKSKNAFLNNPLTIADIELSEGNYKYPVVKSSLMIKSPINPHADLKYMGSIMMIVEVTNYLLSDEEKFVIYDYLSQTIEDIKTNNNPLKVVISYLAKILKISGYDFEINECIMCGNRKNIITFSFDDGGFICQNCYTPDIPKLFNKNQMLAIRESFGSLDTSIKNDNLDDNELIFIILKFVEFIHESYGYNMKSMDLIK